VNYASALNQPVREIGMNKGDIFASSSLLESISREDFAIHLYNGQLHQDPFSTVPLTPLYYVLNEVYFVHSSPAIFQDLIGVTEVENIHKKRFTEALNQLNPQNEPVPKIAFPQDLFTSVSVPQVDPIAGLKTALRVVITDIVQEQRAHLIYDYFARETAGWIRSLYEDITGQEEAHRRIFENLLTDMLNKNKIAMYCPVCGKTLHFEPEEGTLGGCGFCESRLILRIENDDFILRVRDNEQG
jgi:rubrerythrin